MVKSKETEEFLLQKRQVEALESISKSLLVLISIKGENSKRKIINKRCLSCLLFLPKEAITCPRCLNNTTLIEVFD